MTTAYYSVFYSFGLIVFLLGVQGMIFFPLTIVYEIWKHRALKSLPPFRGRVSVIVPAYNEETTIRNTLLTLLESDFPDLEIIVVNDGSTDQTEQCIADLISGKRIIYLKQQNAGKASALNRGISIASGEIVLYTDADSLFFPDTVSLMARWFADPGIDAVCGNDMPLYPQNAIHRFLTITTHIGTGFVRRALSVIGCLQIISGNLGAIRKKTLDEIGGFMTIWGEDLEITFRLHKFGKRIVFDPQPKVMAECPGTLAALWRQRVRWIRSYIKIALHHRELFFAPRYSPFSWYLPINFLNMSIVPLLQTMLLIMLPFACATGLVRFDSVIDILIYLGFFIFMLIAVYSIVLDRAYADLKLLPYGLLILPISYFYNMVVLFSWWKELRQAEETWHKSARRDIQQAQTHGKSRWQVAVSASILTVFLSLTIYLVMFAPGRDTLSTPSALLEQRNIQTQFRLAMSTHFDAWPDWNDAINKVTSRPMIRNADIVGIGAGRAEWTYFKWKDHETDWSNHQKGDPRDLLKVAANTFHSQGPKVAVMIDLFAPAYISKHPQAASVRFDGVTSTDQVGLVELTQGDYGRKLLEMVEYLAANYPIDIISLTEVPYYSYSYNAEDLKSFKRFSGKARWPRNSSGKVDNENHEIWAWKNELMEEYIRKVADAVHRHGKALYVDVPVSWKNFANEGKESGLDYRRMLKHADKIVLWNYFYLEGNSPEVSTALSGYMSRNFPTNAYYISIGLWGKKGQADAASMSAAISATLAGGSKQIWITPNDMLSNEHWKEITRHWIRKIETP
jgi:cellulose synthase/poly-beta-1,6-N-acetylglucosamine synthase-like glycosyltransferase